MSLIIFIDQEEGKFKKAALEALCYGVRLAEQQGTTATAVVLGPTAIDLKTLGSYGADKVLHAADDALKTFDPAAYSKALADAAEKEGAPIIILSHNFNGKAMASMLSVRLKAGLVAGAIGLPDTSEGFVVKKNVFSGKAVAYVNILTEKKIISVNPNAFPIVRQEKETGIETFSPILPSKRIQLKETKKLSGKVPLTEASIIVSGGRGLKGPENWGMIEDLAQALGAATACSRPVADSGWRPHHEHVGQTGITVRPNLYIAIGISGAIQHLAGVNGSKHIVVINKDPEAPFFKAADYGIVGDAFEIVPKLTEAVKEYKEEHSGG